MGTNVLPAASSGDVIPATDHNALVTALLEDLVPRNASRVPTDIAGQLGTSIYRWLRAYLKEAIIGTAGNNLKIYEGAAGELWFENDDEIIKLTPSGVEILIAGVTKFIVNSAGIDWGSQDNFSIPSLKLADRLWDQGGPFSGTQSGSTFADLATYNTPALTANRQYEVVVDWSVESAGSPSDIVLTIDGVDVRQWDDTKLTNAGVQAGDNAPESFTWRVSYTPGTDGVKAIKLRARGITINNTFVTIREF